MRRIELAPFWERPFSLLKVLKWIPEYLFPWNAFHMATALLWWFFVVPDVETMKTLGWGWALWLYAVNAAAIFVFYGTFELIYYVKRKQATRFKYNGRFPADHPSDVFWFKSQNLDNFLRSFFVTIPLWTAVEVFMLWGFANSWATWLSWADHPVYLAALVLVAPVIHEVHFFCDPPPDPLAAALPLGPFGASQFHQSLAVVVAVDAPGRRRALSRRRAVAPGHPVQPDRGAVPAACRRDSAR